MENAQVLIFEDNSNWQNMLKEALVRGGHTVAGIAGTEQMALQYVDRLESLGIRLVTLDNEFPDSEDKFGSGIKILREIRRVDPHRHIRVIGVNGSIKTPGVDVHIDKGNFDDNNFLEIIRRL